MEPSSPAPAEAAERRAPRLLAPLRERPFFLYFVGQLLSQIGNGVFLVALPFLVLDQGGGSAQLGVVLACYGTVRLVAFPLGGTLADRWGARRMMLVSDAMRVVVVLGFALLSTFDPVPLWALLAVAMPLGALDGVFLPASFAVLPTILSKANLGAGNSVNSVMVSSAQIAGPALGGALVGSLKSDIAFVINSATFLASSLTLLAIRPSRPEADREAAQGETVGDGPLTWGAVLRYVLGSALLRMSLLVTLVVNLAYFGMMEVALPSFARNQLGHGAQGFGIILTGFGVGSVIGALCGSTLLRLRRRGLIALVLGVAEGLAVLLVPLGSSIVVATAAMLVAAAIQAVLNVFYVTMIQREVPEGSLGRVMSLIVTCAGAAFPLSTLLAGAATDTTGPTGVIIVAGLGISAAFVLGFFSKPYRNL
ncbi:MFS transporter [Pseudonocardia sp. TRM90224]|uniref:MFS transporter n=1 Tax=Pseudonocardia sp. TRM90224 TaxID=2812678 RepID=UPI001E51BFEA|nr:MFS transporter [Pseudonocardia sp. TRM90224]